MVGSRVMQSSGQKQWWRKLPNTWCSKNILLLLVWKVLYYFSWNLFSSYESTMSYTSLTLFLLAPLLGWLADVKFGRYEVLKFGSIVMFSATIFYYFALFTGRGVYKIGKVLISIAAVLVLFSASCFSAAMLPFLTDQLICATSDELSAVICWYYWAGKLGTGLSDTIMYLGTGPNFTVELAGIFAVPLAVIIISDCLCQQWLDRTHKVTNPIKLIIQVLNYTRKHSYPERRSAFTYIDEEQPTRMDYGKEKFGGPFTEEEVEDVKTVLRLLPIIGASLSEPHIDRDNVPRRGECLYLCMYVAACSVCRLNVPENTPIQSITRSAHAD